MANAKQYRRQLRDAFIQDIRNAWQTYQASYPSRTVYAFVMYGIDGGDPYMWPAFLSEESLADVAREYVDKGLMDSVDEAADDLRFSVADGPDSHLFADDMPAETLVLDSIETDEDEWLGWVLVAEPAIDALRSLDEEGLFGKGREREKILLLVHVEDCLHDYFDESAKLLNSATAYEELKAQTAIEGAFKSCGALAITEDGKHLFAACTVPDPNSPGDTINEVVLYSMDGKDLSRRWQYYFPSFGDSVRDMAIPGSHDCVWTVRLKYEKSKGTGLLQQFSIDSNHPQQERSVEGEPAAIAASHDGSQVALLTRESLMVFDSSLELLERVEVSKGHAVTFLKDSTLLVGTEKGMLRLVDDQLQRTAVDVNAFSIDVDDSEQKLAIGRWFDILNFDEKSEFGMQLYELPSLRLIREVTYPGHQLVLPTLSHDGTRLACMANRLHGDRKTIVVFDTATGELLEETKSDFVSMIAFVPNSHTIAVPATGFMAKEPVSLLN